MAKIVKLGELASIFSDPTSGLLVIGKQIVELTVRQESSRKVKQAISGGHLIHATDDELKKYQKTQLATEKSTAHEVKKLEEMTFEELHAWVDEKSGWDKADRKKVKEVKDAKELLEMVSKINKSYE